jgi:Ca2+-binding EF-hand superfamily protein
MLCAAERLFQLFDTKHTGVVDFEEFLVGIAVCVRGTPDERISFLFHLYDLNG